MRISTVLVLHITLSPAGPRRRRGGENKEIPREVPLWVYPLNSKAVLDLLPPSGRDLPSPLSLITLRPKNGLDFLPRPAWYYFRDMWEMIYVSENPIHTILWTYVWLGRSVDQLGFPSRRHPQHAHHSHPQHSIHGTFNSRQKNLKKQKKNKKKFRSVEFAWNFIFCFVLFWMWVCVCVAWYFNM